MKKFLYIINPTAGKGRGNKTIQKVRYYCDKNKINYKVSITKYHKHATEIAKNENSNFTHIIAVGGDGTANEVLNGIDFNRKIIFAALQVGTGNDLIKNYNFPKQINDALSVIHNETKQEIKKIDIGKVTFKNANSNKLKEHLFINNLGIGFDAYVGYLNMHDKLLKGISSYVLAVFKALIKYKMLECDILFNDKIFSGKKLMITIGNGISSGGGFYLTPNAIIDDELLDISIFEKLSRFKLLKVLPKALLNKLETVSEAKMYNSKRVEIKLKEPYFMHCDGEVISNNVTSATVKCLPSALKIITGKK